MPALRGSSSRAGSLVERLELWRARRRTAEAAYQATRPGRAGRRAARRAGPRLDALAPSAYLRHGFATVGDDRSGARATAVAVSGPGLLRGPADMVLIAEEPGIGLGAHYAGLDGADPGEAFNGSPPHVKLDVSGPAATCGRSVPMWAVRTGPTAPTGPCSSVRRWATGCGRCCGPPTPAS